MTGKAMADMWNNLELTGKQVYKEEEELQKMYMEEVKELKKSKEGGNGDD